MNQRMGWGLEVPLLSNIYFAVKCILINHEKDNNNGERSIKEHSRITPHV